MQVESVDPKLLRPSPGNPRKHPEAQIEKIAESIRRYGFTQPILIDSQKVVIAGHGRLLAARHLGLKVVPCISLDDLTPQQVAAYRIADNRIAQESEWDMVKLEAEIRELAAQGEALFTGLDQHEIDALISPIVFERGTRESQVGLNAKGNVCPNCGYKA
jgi:ParB-like chromosome segregation protein Spo0J